jgi:hypothetical protein
MRAAANQRALVEDVIHVSQLSAERQDEHTLTLGVEGLRPGKTLAELHVQSETDAEAKAGDERVQIGEPLYAIVTRSVHDAFDLKRERPIGIHRVAVRRPKTVTQPDPSTRDLGERVWSPPGGTAYREDLNGRVRFVRVPCGLTKPKGGFEDTSEEFPASFFSQALADAPTMIPSMRPASRLESRSRSSGRGRG